MTDIIANTIALMCIYGNHHYTKDSQLECSLTVMNCIMDSKGKLTEDLNKMRYCRDLGQKQLIFDKTKEYL